MIHTLRTLAAVAISVLAAVSMQARVYGQADEPPSDLSVAGSVVTWRDNSASETGFRITLVTVPQGRDSGGSGLASSIDVERGVTSYDLCLQSNPPKGPHSITIAVVLPSGEVLYNEQGVGVELDYICSTTATESSGRSTMQLPRTGGGSADGVRMAVSGSSILSVLFIGVALVVHGARNSKRA
jgi:hypothetical protein